MDAGGRPIDVVATTMSGSLRDQRKVSRIGPEFRARTTRPVTVHLADTHSAAREMSRALLEAGRRTLVSAGGAGTLNAVLEGALEAGPLPADLRLGVLRKGSADLVGKVLGVPDDLPAAVAAIVAALDADSLRTADILAVETTLPDGTPCRRSILGFGGVGVFGEVPRFTETRLIRWYKGVLSQAFGDLGPFLVGLTLATGWWQLLRALGRVPAMRLLLDDDELLPERWAAVMVLNGDLGRDFPLGRGLSLSSGTFRVVVLRYRGLAVARRQIRACRSGDVLRDPDACDAVAATVSRAVISPVQSLPHMINIDGLRQPAVGESRWSVAGTVRLVDASAMRGG